MHAHKQRNQNLVCKDIKGIQLHYRPILLYIFEKLPQRAILSLIFQTVYVHAQKQRSQNPACTDIKGLQLPIVLYFIENMKPKAIFSPIFQKV